MNKEQTIIDFEIIWKKINLSLTTKEEAILSQWLNEDSSHQKFLDDAVRYHNEGSDFADLKAVSAKGWDNLAIKGSKNNNRQSIWIISAAAAAVITLLMVVTYFMPVKKEEMNALAFRKAELIQPGTNQATLRLADGTIHDLSAKQSLVLNEGGSEIKSEGSKLQYTQKKGVKEEIKYNTLSIPRGGEFFLQLADGTKVWLNSESVLRYPVQFNGKERKVELSGEAFFEVTRNEKVPFLVESGEQTVKVLGTEFNISSYNENPLVYTTLVKGSVEVFANMLPDIKQILSPNEQSTISKGNGQLSKIAVNTYKYIAWKDGRFVFDDQPLGEIMKTLSKWYDIDVVFANEELKNFRFTGDLLRYTDFGEVLKKISKTNEVNFLIENKLITIR
jgi:transmembrane sensor